MQVATCYSKAKGEKSTTYSVFTCPPACLCTQVHDINGRVSATEKLLRSKGFTSVHVYKEPRFQDCNLYMVYGSKRSTGNSGSNVVGGSGGSGGRSGNKEAGEGRRR